MQSWARALNINIRGAWHRAMPGTIEDYMTGDVRVMPCYRILISVMHNQRVVIHSAIIACKSEELFTLQRSNRLAFFDKNQTIHVFQKSRFRHEPFFHFYLRNLDLKGHRKL